MNIVTLVSFENELEKISSAGDTITRLLNNPAARAELLKNPAVAGAAIGGGLGLLGGIRHEMKTRDAEEVAGLDPRMISHNRANRAGRLLLSTAASAGTGALLGHVGSKALAGTRTEVGNLSRIAGENVRGQVEKVNIWKMLNPFRRG